jgi:hypothetical protein
VFDVRWQQHGLGVHRRHAWWALWMRIRDGLPDRRGVRHDERRMRHDLQRNASVPRRVLLQWRVRTRHHRKRMRRRGFDVLGLHRIDQWPDVPRGHERLRLQQRKRLLTGAGLRRHDTPMHVGMQFDTAVRARRAVFGRYVSGIVRQQWAELLQRNTMRRRADVFRRYLSNLRRRG